ncbi:MAG: hypothetical protein CL624_09260 [Arcobacter sp.]|nr:hypothetical protein [Arcobacter sp.]|tara:strand:+ start:8920 stop:11241 length:2322 start_codon:yes stop_codon:yes gene_type:complete
MPISAINTGNIDLILSPEDIGNELLDIVQYPIKMQEKSANDNRKNYTDVYKNILNKLTQETKVDFSQYKSSTIIRRIERRMTTLKVTSVVDYNNHLLKNKDEVQELFKDILIGVTSFFRDGECFEILQKVLTEYLNKKDEKVIRIWTPGCSTGEEPYTIAMILSEILGSRAAEYKIQIFASDLDVVAIETARKGVYPESAILDIPKNFKSKYFTVKGDQFELIKPIKEMIIFSKHDITRDPPFLRLDLVTCRNLLIYFTGELQKKIFPLFHYALKANGILFLGKSESVGQFQNYFKTVDKKWKIYEAIYLGRKQTPIMHTNYVPPKYKEPDVIVNVAKPPSMNEILVSKIQEFVLPSCVIVNEMMDIIYVKGNNKYLIRPDGDSTDNIFKNINHKLSVELRTLFTEVDGTKKDIIKSKYHKINLDKDIVKFVRIAIIPVLTDLNVPPIYILFFQDEDLEHIQPIELGTVGNDSEKIKQVELELVKTREQLQTVIEELETSNEEMQSMNEELQSSNEELQSSNEELETTNEELQSTNEELQTAYAELRSSYNEKEEQQNELVKLQTKIQKANTLLDESQALANMASWEWNILSNNVVWTNNYYNILELDSSTFTPTHESFLGFINPFDRDRFEKCIDNAIKGKALFDITFKVKTKNSNIKTLRAIATVIFAENKKALKMVGNVVDITAQEQLEEKNNELLYLTKEIIKSENGLITCDEDDIIINISEIALQILDKKEKDVVGEKISKFISSLKYKELALENKDTEYKKIYIIER